MGLKVLEKKPYDDSGIPSRCSRVLVSSCCEEGRVASLRVGR